MTVQLDKLLTTLREAVRQAPALYVPISGGTDSALVFWLLNQVASDKTIGCHFYASGSKPSLNLDYSDSWFSHIGRVEEFDVGECYDDFDEKMWQQILSLSLGKRSGFFPTAGWLVGCRNQTEDRLGTYSLASRVATFLQL